jgi:putative copper resistance protein D
MIEHDLLPIVLRVLVYVATIAVAGAVLFAFSFPRAASEVQPALRRQVVAGFCLLLLVEPMRYVVFQLAISGGDWSLAFGPGLRWMGLQTPIGQAAAVRLIAALLVVTVARRSAVVALAAALVLIGSFLLEGHTVSSDARIALGALLFIHLAAVHWWLGALYPLMALTRCAAPKTLSAAVEAFGAWAAWVVAALLGTGVLLLLIITGVQLNVDSDYQQRFLVKLLLVAGLLSIAAWNKLRLTPLLRRDPQSGAARLRGSIRLEIAVALSILAATAWITSTAPDA